MITGGTLCKAGSVLCVESPHQNLSESEHRETVVYTVVLNYHLKINEFFVSEQCRKKFIKGIYLPT